MTTLKKMMDKYYKNLYIKQTLDFIFQGTQYGSRYIHEYINNFMEDKRKGKFK